MRSSSAARFWASSRAASRGISSGRVHLLPGPRWLPGDASPPGDEEGATAAAAEDSSAAPAAAVVASASGCAAAAFFLEPCKRKPIGHGQVAVRCASCCMSADPRPLAHARPFPAKPTMISRYAAAATSILTLPVLVFLVAAATAAVPPLGSRPRILRTSARDLQRKPSVEDGPSQSGPKRKDKIAQRLEVTLVRCAQVRESPLARGTH